MRLLNQLLVEHSKDFDLFDRAIALAYMGSISHGTYQANSIDDKDVMGIVVPNREYYLGLNTFGSRDTLVLTKQYWDVTIYELRKFVRLLIKNNPNVLSLLYLEDSMFLRKIPQFQRLIDNRDLFLSKQSYYSFCGYAKSQLDRIHKFDYYGYMGEKRKALVDKFGFDCYTDDTEFLTDKGWKLYDNILPETKLATIFLNRTQLPMLHRHKFGVEYQQFTERFNSLFTGNIYRIFGDYVETTVTPNHRLLYEKMGRNTGKKYNWCLGEASKLPDCFSILLAPSSKTTLYQHPDFIKRLPIPLTTYMSLMGWFLSDGTFQFRNKKPHSLVISQSKGGRLCREMSRFQNKYGVVCKSSIYKYSRKRGSPSFLKNRKEEWQLSIRNKEIINQLYMDCGHSKEKRIPRWVFLSTKRMMSYLFKGLIYGDGTIVSAEQKKFIFHNSSKLLCDDVQELVFMCGWVSSLNGPYETNSSKYSNAMYQLFINCSISKVHTIIKNKSVKKIPVENQRIVCFSVPNGILITRKNGKISIHGNCKACSHLIRLLKTGIDILEKGTIEVKRKDNSHLIAIKRGEVSLEKIKEEANNLFKTINISFQHCKLREYPDTDKINKLLVDIVGELI